MHENKNADSAQPRKRSIVNIIIPDPFPREKVESGDARTVQYSIVEGSIRRPYLAETEQFTFHELFSRWFSLNPA